MFRVELLLCYTLVFAADSSTLNWGEKTNILFYLLLGRMEGL